MTTPRFLSAKQLLLVRLFLVFFISYLLFRVGFAVAFHSTTDSISIPIFLKAFYLGLKFDFRVALLMTLPMLLGGLFVLSPIHSAKANSLWRWLYFIFWISTLIILTGDIFYYAYLHDRINASIVQFLANPIISAQMVWESYPVVWVVLALFLVGFFGFKIFAAIFKEALFAREQRTPKKRVMAGALLFVIFVVGVYGKLAYYPLRWSEAYFSGDRYTTALALNPIHNLSDTFSNREKNYDIEQVKKYYDVVANYLGVKNKDKDKLNFSRLQPAQKMIEFSRQPNVVVVIMESLSAHRMGAFGNGANATATLDRLADNGWLFENFYTPSEGTARGVFALVTGLSDINKDRTSSRNPMLIEQNTAVNVFTEHEKYYFIGGSANWGNIRGFLTHNIQGLKLYEEGMFASPRTDVWGISDYHLLLESAKILKNRDSEKPFFAFVQTAGFHRPYSIPEDRGDFKLEQLSEEQLKENGFLHNEEYNSLRFMDYSLGVFIDELEKNKMLENTIFIVLGDHGLPDNNAKNLTPTMVKYSIERFHVPLVFYGPKYFKARRIKTVIGQHDILPSFAAIMGYEFHNKALGRNVFNPDLSEHNFTFSYVYYRKPHQLFLFDEEYMVEGTPGDIDGLYNYRSQQGVENIREEQPERFKKMQELLEGLYHTSKYLLYHNKN